MNTRHVPSGTYGEALPSGAYAVETQHGIETHLGRIALHNGTRPLFLRITETPIFQIAGQAHDSGRVLHYIADKGWTLRADLSHGQSGHIFDHAGILRVVSPAPNQTSQGYRYVAENGTLVLGDATYADPARRIWEYTTYGDVTIGQGEGGCIAIRGNDRYVLEPGDCRFVRFNRSGNSLAVTIVKLPERKTVLLWLDVSELASFPREAVPNPGTTIPNPGMPPPPEPPKPMQKPASLLPTVQAVRLKYPNPTQADLGAMLNEIAWIHRADGWGLSRKPSGNHTTQPRTGERIAVDIQHHKYTGTIWDVFADAGGTTTPMWGEANPHNDPARIWIAPVEPLSTGADGDPGDENDTPTPPFTGIDKLRPGIDKLRDDVDMLIATVEKLRADLDGGLDEVLGYFETLQAKFALLESRRYVAKGDVKVGWLSKHVELPVEEAQ